MNLAQIEREYSSIMQLSSSDERDRKLADLMTQMEQEFDIPVLAREEWEKQNRAIIALYRKLSQSRSL